MSYLRKKVIRGKTRKHDVYFEVSCNEEKNIYRLKISSEEKFDELMFMNYLKNYLYDYIKTRGEVLLDDDNSWARMVH